MAHSCRRLSWFLYSRNGLWVFLLLLDRMLVHRKSLPRNLLCFRNNLPGWREALWESFVLAKNTALCPWPGLESRLLAPGTMAITMRPMRLPQEKSSGKIRELDSNNRDVDRDSDESFFNKLLDSLRLTVVTLPAPAELSENPVEGVGRQSLFVKQKIFLSTVFLNNCSCLKQTLKELQR